MGDQVLGLHSAARCWGFKRMSSRLTMSTCIGFLARPHTCRAPFRTANLAQYRRRASIMTQARTSRKDQLVECKKAVAEHLKNTHCMPIMIRLAWHDSGTYDKVWLCRRLPSVRSPAAYSVRELLWSCEACWSLFIPTAVASRLRLSVRRL